MKSASVKKKPASPNENSRSRLSRKLLEPKHKASSLSTQTIYNHQDDDAVTSVVSRNHSVAYATLITKETQKFRVIALACILRNQSDESTSPELVVLVTNNICSKTRAALKRYFNLVTEVQRLPGKRTKFNVLSLLRYEKVLYLSNKLLIMDPASIEKLFEMEAPAGIVTIFKEKDQTYWHGVKCRPDDIDKSLGFATGVKTSILLLKPNEIDYLKVLSCKQSSHVSKQGVNFVPEDCTFIANLYKKEWTHLHQKFSFHPWLENTNTSSPVCYDMNKLQPEAFDVKTERLRPVHEWRKKVISLSSDDPYLRKLIEKYDWFEEVVSTEEFNSFNTDRDFHID